LDRFIVTYGLVPARYSVPEAAAYFSFGQQVLSFFSYMFLHGGFWHLLGNMWSLYIFGDNVEDRLGPFRYLAFYMCCGFASGTTHLLLNWHSPIPTIGASGAIAGVMGAYFLLYPKARILTLIPILFIPYFVELSAFFFLGIWFLFQFISAAGSSAHGGGVAWWAHIGGFVFGILVVKLFLRIPETGLSRQIRRRAPQRKTHRLQIIRTGAGASDDPNLYGTIAVTAREATFGTSKLVNIPWGFQRRLFKISIPAGSKEGTTLRLAGMGRELVRGGRGDLFLKIVLQPETQE
jgi:membrane associated rhomboid family serine protease